MTSTTVTEDISGNTLANGYKAEHQENNQYKIFKDMGDHWRLSGYARGNNGKQAISSYLEYLENLEEY